ncbi:hypothetical protein XA68_11133 [Ophiocordyceps unilateralis]|uniref:Uncharacterized protein n=1 Tax=Ophiocordyceps unilateralis TaxID=268505 RepID=A0A2A9PHD6_OPHUN|nr:hypothetical protein XA68_11133 [Ophiocordyceps unilateralis]
MPGATTTEISSDEVIRKVAQLQPTLGAGSPPMEEKEMLEIGKTILHYLERGQLLNSKALHEVNTLFYLWNTKKSDSLNSYALDSLAIEITAVQIFLSNL